jgi:hypothetical protein
MKTLVKNGCSLYLFPDDDEVVIAENNVTIGAPPKLVISDCNLSNSVVFENITPPEDWYGRKYLFDGVTWAENPSFVDPRAEG